MTFELRADSSGRYICTIGDDGGEVTTVTASNVPDAGDDLLAAVDAARRTGYGECLWGEAAGEYRWMFKRDGAQLTVVVLWSSGTLTGWQHVFRNDCAFDAFEETVGRELARLRGLSELVE